MPLFVSTAGPLRAMAVRDSQGRELLLEGGGPFDLDGGLSEVVQEAFVRAGILRPAPEEEPLPLATSTSLTTGLELTTRG